MPYKLNIVRAARHRKSACDERVVWQLLRGHRHTIEFNRFPVVPCPVIERIDIKYSEIGIFYRHFVAYFIRQFLGKTYLFSVFVVYDNIRVFVHEP